MTASVVVFDLGNVLIPWDIRRLYRDVITDPADLDRFLGEVLTTEVNAQVDLGRPLAEVTNELAERYPDDAENIAVFRDRWVGCVSDPIPETVAILTELVGAGVRCLALSNFGRDTFQSVEDRFAPVLGQFDGMVISGFEGVIKPDPAIYHLLCDRYEIEPADAFFIDDSQANIAAANELGFETFHFPVPVANGARDLREELVGRGLLPAVP